MVKMKIFGEKSWDCGRNVEILLVKIGKNCEYCRVPLRYKNDDYETFRQRGH